ncbi:MAG TPA: CoA transferase [Gammaproteobacteria bacterium]|nr:CoA transferase [Gammaproteobacteria bacterium]
MHPLKGVTVIDFSTLLPGPLASLVLAEAGAEVIKVERPGGEAMRSFGTPFGETSIEFLLLNRGKRSIELDLKSSGARRRLAPLIARADVLIEQFRPGVMDRLGLGYETLKESNPRLIYCALTGYGQSGPKSGAAGHDLNYLAETGLLRIGADANGDPVIPPALIADIGGGAYPVVINVLLALRQRELDGRGCFLDIAMTDHLFPFQYWAQGMWEATGRTPNPGAEVLTGGSPRYQVYRARDGKYLAAAPLEQRFWDNFCDAIDLDPRLRRDREDPQSTKAAVAAIIGTRTASEWMRVFDGTDACVCVVADIGEAMGDPQFADRGLFSHRTGDENNQLTAAAVPLSPQFRSAPATERAPALGEGNLEYLTPPKEEH